MTAFAGHRRPAGGRSAGRAALDTDGQPLVNSRSGVTETHGDPTAGPLAVQAALEAHLKWPTFTRTS
jgi:hypothetical protein